MPAHKPATRIQANPRPSQWAGLLRCGFSRMGCPDHGRGSRALANKPGVFWNRRL